MPFSLTQQKALAWAPRISGSLSVLGSACIAKVILSDREKAKGTHQRILLAMSIMDVFASFALALTTWPVPKGSPGIWGASGNQTTCTIQGFFTHTVTWTPALNASLAIYYLLSLRYEWSEEKLRKFQPLLVGLPVVFSYGTSIACIPLTLFNNANLWCWIAPFPLNCKDSHRYGDSANCIRGDNAWIYRWAFTYVPAWLSIVVATVSMAMVFWTVLQHERAVDKFQEDGLHVRKQSKRVAWQAFWYVLAFYITWIPGTTVRIMQISPQTKGKTFFPLILLMAIFFPMQGFFNCLVFSRGRYYKFRRENQAAGKMEAFLVAAFALNATRRVRTQELEQTSSLPETQTKPSIATEAILCSEQHDTCT